MTVFLVFRSDILKAAPFWCEIVLKLNYVWFKLSNGVKARENTSHTQHKLESVRKRLVAATNIHSQKQNIIQELQSQLAELEKRRKIFEDQIQADQSEKNIELKQTQQDQYQVNSQGAEIHKGGAYNTRKLLPIRPDSGYL